MNGGMLLVGISGMLFDDIKRALIGGDVCGEFGDVCSVADNGDTKL